MEIGDRLFDMGMDITANKMIERTLTFTNAGQRDTEDYAGEPGYPEWTAFIRNYVSWGDWNATWQVSYKSRVDQDPEALDSWSDVYGTVNADGNAVSSDTCYGIANNDVDCRDVGFIKSFVTHNMSLYYRADTYSVGFGVRNVFDKEPPKVDGTEISSYSNVPIGYGYSLFGREYFLNISKAF
jgi:iron complex outermembrane receptor protein